MTIKDLANQIVKNNLTVPSKRFGSIVLEVDDKGIGNSVRELRLKKEIEAQDIAEAMRETKCLLSLLEHGERKWNLERLVAYISAVNAISKKRGKKKTANGGRDEVQQVQ
jgi:predicted transcriptional regulator